jgi:hypothetical protein
MSPPSTCTGVSFQAEIQRHFAGTISPKAERALRLHLVDCASCRDEYEKYLVLAEIDPVALSAEERIGRGLGVRPRPAAVGWPVLAGAAAACALVLTVAAPWSTSDRSAVGSDAEFTPRGPALARDDFVVYRIRQGQEPERAPRRMRRDDELAFAYTNPSGFGYLLVFGVDSHGDVRWYHPEWSNADATPRAVAIAKGADVHELPDAVAQKLEGSSLRLYAVFTNEPLTVRDVEGSLASDKPGHPELKLPGVLVREWLVEVE